MGISKPNEERDMEELIELLNDWDVSVHAPAQLALKKIGKPFFVLRLIFTAEFAEHTEIFNILIPAKLVPPKAGSRNPSSFPFTFIFSLRSLRSLRLTFFYFFLPDFNKAGCTCKGKRKLTTVHILLQTTQTCRFLPLKSTDETLKWFGKGWILPTWK